MLEEKKCKVKNCENEYRANEYCNKHYFQLRQCGKILERTRFDPNEIIDCGEYYEICLYEGQSEQIEVARTKIDKEDLEKVKKYKWCLTNKGYVHTVVNKKTIRLHQLILGKSPMGYEVDHRDTNKLNNRKYNLRFVTDSQNSMNRKGKGYWWSKKNKKWIARIGLNRKYIYLGCFINEQDAQKVVREARQKYFGEYAYKGNN